MKLTATRRTGLIGVLALVLALLAAWLLVLSPRSEAIAEVSGQTTVAAAANDALRGQITARRAQQDALPQERKVADALAERFPASAEQAKLFRMITAAAAQAGIAPQSLTNLTVNPPTGGTAGGPASAQLPGISQTGGQIAAQQVSMDVEGSAGEIRALVGNLEKLPRAFALTALSVTDRSGGSGKVGKGGQSVSITGQMFLMPQLADPTVTAG